MTIRCKFKCDTISENLGFYTYHASPVYGSEENRVFWESTPAGSFQISVVKSKGKLFGVGNEHFLDISEAV